MSAGQLAVGDRDGSHVRLRKRTVPGCRICLGDTRGRAVGFNTARVRGGAEGVVRAHVDHRVDSPDVAGLVGGDRSAQHDGVRSAKI